MNDSKISITIPKKVNRGDDLIAIPRKDYEGLLRFYKEQATKNKTSKLSKGLQEALKDVKAGRISKGFDNAEDLVASILSHS